MRRRSDKACEQAGAQRKILDPPGAALGCMPVDNARCRPVPCGPAMPTQFLLRVKEPAPPPAAWWEGSESR